MDDCWSAYLRDSQGELQPDPSKFPPNTSETLFDLIDYVHSQNLLFGLYSGNISVISENSGRKLIFANFKYLNRCWPKNLC